MLKNWARIILHALRKLLPHRVKEGLRPILARGLKKIEKMLRPEQADSVFACASLKIQSAVKTSITHVSVVIPTKNAGPLFAEVMERIRAQQSCCPVTITIVDSGSTDDTVVIAQKSGAHVVSIDPTQFN